MTSKYGIWWFKMPIVYHPKTFVTNPKWFWGMIKSGLKMFWLDVKNTRLRESVNVEEERRQKSPSDPSEFTRSYK